MKRTKINFHFLLSTILSLGLFSASCDKDEKEPPCENCDEEIITSIELSFENIDSGIETVFAFRDLDGIDGGTAPTEFDTIRLTAGDAYHVQISLLNESVSPAEDITSEVEEEGVDHQFFYTITPSSLADVTYDDIDANGNPVGINTNVTTGTAGDGTYKVTLKHQPGIKDGNITTGETDIEVDFVLEVD